MAVGSYLSLKMVISLAPAPAPAPAQDRPLFQVPEKQQLPKEQVLLRPTGQSLGLQVRT